MKRLLLILAPLAFLSCAKDCPETPKSPSIKKGEVIKTYSYWRARVAIPEGVTVGITAPMPDNRSQTFEADDICVIVPETKVEVTASDKEYVMIVIGAPFDLDNFAPVAGGHSCPEVGLLITVGQYRLMADEAIEAENEATSRAGRAERLRQGDILNPPRR